MDAGHAELRREIETLRGRVADLERQLTVPGISEAKEITIHNRIAALQQTIAAHINEIAACLAKLPSRRGYRVRCTLEGWRRWFGLREKVVTLAQKLAAHGTVTPDGMNIELNLWFAEEGKAAKFRDGIVSAGGFYLRERFQMPLYEEDDRGDGEGPVANYARVGNDAGDKNSPDEVTSRTSTGLAKRRMTEAHTYHCVMAFFPEIQEQVHLVPRPLLKRSIDGAWMLLSADTAFNRWTDAAISLVEFDIEGEHPARGDSHTPVLLRISFREPDPERWQHFKRCAVEEARLDDLLQSAVVPIYVRTEHLPQFRAVIAWRKETVAAAIARNSMGDKLSTNDNPRGSAWYRLVPLTKYEDLKEFAAPPNSPRAESKRPRTSSDAEGLGGDEDTSLE